MGKDTGWKEYFSDSSRYADLINGLACDGIRMVTEEDLQELDSQTRFFRSYGLLLGGLQKDRLLRKQKKGKAGARRKPQIRDIVRKVAFGVNFAVVGIENQEMIDYSMVLRNLSYDTGEYEKQAAKIRKMVRRHSEGLSAGEYFYGFRKDSRLHPVVTFILYAGVEEWDGPVTLHGMLDFTDIPQGIRKLAFDYRINLIEIRKWMDTSVFQTDVRQVFDFIRCAEDKDALAELVANDPYYSEMEEDAYDVVTSYAHAEELTGKKEYYRKDGKVDMCTAIREMMEDSRAQGLSEGKMLLEEKTRRMIENMIRRGMSDGDIMAIAECDQELVEEVRRSCKK